MKVRLGISLGANTPHDQLAGTVDHRCRSRHRYGVRAGPHEHLKVGTSVAVLAGRHPVLLAKQLASTIFVTKEGRRIGIQNTSGFAPNGAALYWLLRHYWETAPS